MKPEQLKVIAEGMGYEGVEIVRGATVWITKTIIYRPHTTNNDQMVEIMEKLRLTIWCEPAIKEWCASKQDSLGDTNYQDEGETINEAVCNAAYEYFKQE